MLRGSIAAGCSLLLSLVLLPVTAHGEDAARAKALFHEAEQHFKLGEFKRALPLFKKAYKAKALPPFLFNIGQCHRHMGDCKMARFFFVQFLQGPVQKRQQVQKRQVR